MPDPGVRRRLVPADPCPIDHNLPDAAERYMQRLAEEAIDRGCTVRVSGGEREVVLYIAEPGMQRGEIAWRWTWDRRPVFAN
jgi:hypothetical protein